MIARKRTKVPMPTDRKSSFEIVMNGRHLTPGMEFTLWGGGRYTFMSYTKTDQGAEWIECRSTDPKRSHLTRYFRPERIRTVHTKKKVVSR